MIPKMLDGRLPAFLDQVKRLDPEEQKDAFMNEVMESGGVYQFREAGEKPGILFEIALHGVAAVGTSEDDVIRNWITAADTAALNTETSAYETALPTGRGDSPNPLPGHFSNT